MIESAIIAQSSRSIAYDRDALPIIGIKVYCAKLSKHVVSSSCAFFVGLALASMTQSGWTQSAKPRIPSQQYRTHVEDDYRVIIDSDGVSPEAEQIGVQLSEMFDHIARQHRRRIVLFIHGGLTTLADANENAKNLWPVIRSDDHNAYPIFLNWEAGFTSSYGRHLFYERNGISYRGTPSAWSAVVITPLVFLADVGKGVANHGMNTILNFGKVLENNDSLYDGRPRSFVTKNKFFETLRFFSANPAASQAEDKFFHNGLSYRANRQPPLINLYLGPDITRIDVGGSALGSATIPMQVVTEPILDGFGSPAWKNMVRRTRTMFFPAGNFITVSDQTDQPGLNHGAAYQFFAQLNRFLKDHPDYYVDIVGHSMGAIVANEALRNFPDLRIRNLVYMGAACSIRDFLVVGGAYLKTHLETEFYNLSLHPRKEIDETNANGLPVRGSLLTWIDEFFQTPESFGDRTLGSFENVVIAYQLLPQTNHVHLKAFGITAGREPAGPQKHGEFGQFRFWRSEYWRTDVPLGQTYEKL
jgi:pimeloyl-ACP methyl ester carboxylesterase